MREKEKRKRQVKGLGIALSVVALLLAAVLVYAAEGGQDPGDAKQEEAAAGSEAVTEIEETGQDITEKSEEETDRETEAYETEIYEPETYGPEIYGPEIYGPETYGPEAYGPETYEPEIYETEAIKTEENETEVNETETEPGTEMESEEETGTKMETEEETGTETVTEAETEAETKTETEAETETEKETEMETETETEVLVQVIHVSQIQLQEGSAVREYDGTDNVRLTYRVSWEEWMTDGGILSPPDTQQPFRELPAGVSVSSQAHTSCPDAGEWPVICDFSLEGENAGNYTLAVDETQLLATILPRKLRVAVPPGWKRYGEKASMKHMHLSGEPRIEGFLAGPDGREIIPEDFEMPELTVDTKVVGRWSEMYTPEGKQKIYRKGLKVRMKKEDGTGREILSGNPGKNYQFAEELITGGDVVIMPGRIVPGKDYTIYTDYGAPVFAGDNTVITALQGGLGIEPAGTGYNQGSFVYTQGGEGEAVLYLSMTDEKGHTLAQSEPVSVLYMTDSFPPAVQADISGASDIIDGVYYAGKAELLVSVSDTGGSGIAAAQCLVTDARGNTQTVSCTEGCTYPLTSEGMYTIRAEASDRVGNKARTEIRTVVIDTSAPLITISGVEDQSANSGEISILAETADHNYRKGSLSAVLRGPGPGRLPQPSVSSVRGGERLVFPAVPGTRDYDGNYVLTVSSCDLAGNEATKTIRFSVNRHGSSYGFDQDTERMLGTYYHTGSFPVVFTETNVDEIKEAGILISHNGKVRLLDKDEIVTDRKENQNGNVYTYTIPASVFQKEGVYEVILMSGDAAGNRMDTLSNGLRAGFVVDRTAPDCLVSGIEPMGVYEENSRVVIIEPRDNLQLDRVSIAVDREVIREADRHEMTASDGLLRVILRAEKRWQTLSVTVWDAAGNMTAEEDIPVWISPEPVKDIPAYPQDMTEKTDAAGTRQSGALVPDVKKAGVREKKRLSLTEKRTLKEKSTLKEEKALKERIKASDSETSETDFQITETSETVSEILSEVGSGSKRNPAAAWFFSVVLLTACSLCLILRKR